MKTNSIQLLIRSTEDAFSSADVLINYSGIKVLKTHQFSNKKYLAVDILILLETQPETVLIEVIQKGKKQKINWLLNSRRADNGTLYTQGVNSADFIDLIMVNRFSNGDPTNDHVKGMKNQSLDRNQIYDRHRSDLQGVINNLDYQHELGIATLWYTPVMENNYKNRSNSMCYYQLHIPYIKRNRQIKDTVFFYFSLNNSC